MNCPNCDNPFPWYAVFRLNFGVRYFRCKVCNARCGMNANIFFRWSVLPFALVVLSVGIFLLPLQGGLAFGIFAASFILIRLAWMFVSPRVVPLQLLNGTKKVP